MQQQPQWALAVVAAAVVAVSLRALWMPSPTSLASRIVAAAVPPVSAKTPRAVFIHRLVPRLAGTSRKGQAGRVGVVGGSEEYTGAPYYAAMASLRAGADLSFVFCQASASLPIKAYSPELIVHPSHLSATAHASRLSALVLGPGLGRDPAALEEVAQVILHARKMSLPIVLDGDALWLLKDRPELVRGYPLAALTPNEGEFDRLYRAAFGRAPAGPLEASALSVSERESLDGAFLPASDPRVAPVTELSRWFEGCTVLRKGPVDAASDGAAAVLGGRGGSPRRCGGQGDLLAGSLGLFWGWAAKEQPEDSTARLAAVFGASLLVRRAAEMAFDRHGRGTTTPEILQDLAGAFYAALEHPDSGHRASKM